MSGSDQVSYDWTKPLPEGTLDQDRGDYLYEILELKRGWIFDRLRETIMERVNEINANSDKDLVLAIRPDTKDGFRLFSAFADDLKRQVWFTLQGYTDIVASRRDSSSGDCGTVSYTASPEVALELIEGKSRKRPLVEIAEEYCNWLITSE